MALLLTITMKCDCFVAICLEAIDVCEEYAMKLRKRLPIYADRQSAFLLVSCLALWCS